MSPSSTALNGCVFFHSGCLAATAFTRSSAKANWMYIGCSTHSVPSLSNTAMRSGSGDEVGRALLGHLLDERDDRRLRCRVVPGRQRVLLSLRRLDGAGKMARTAIAASQCFKASRSPLVDNLLMFSIAKRASSDPADARTGRPPHSLAASVVTCLHAPDLLHHLLQIVACRVLKRREVDVGLEMLQPQLLADGQDVPVIDVGGGR